MNRFSLLKQIYEASFGIDDAVLFLDTHPEDKHALEFLEYCYQLRSLAMKEYNERYEPLSCKDQSVCKESGLRDTDWLWGMTPMPWEGGNCPCGITKNDYSFQ